MLLMILLNVCCVLNLVWLVQQQANVSPVMSIIRRRLMETEIVSPVMFQIVKDAPNQIDQFA